MELFLIYLNSYLVLILLISIAYSVTLSKGQMGQVRVTYFGHDGPICSNGFDDADARVLCREAGYVTGFAYRYKNARLVAFFYF